MTFFNWPRSEQSKVNTLTALPSSPARQFASLMLIPCSLNVCPTVARMPGRFAVMTRSCTGRLIFAFESHEISTRRSGSVSNALGQPRRWTVTPRPRVMKPMISSPGSGLQHFA